MARHRGRTLFAVAIDFFLHHFDFDQKETLPLCKKQGQTDPLSVPFAF